MPIQTNLPKSINPCHARRAWAKQLCHSCMAFMVCARVTNTVPTVCNLLGTHRPSVRSVSCRSGTSHTHQACLFPCPSLPRLSQEVSFPPHLHSRHRPTTTLAKRKKEKNPTLLHLHILVIHILYSDCYLIQTATFPMKRLSPESFVCAGISVIPSYYQAAVLCSISCRQQFLHLGYDVILQR